MKTLYIIDISSFIFRAYYAIRSLKNSKGMPTNATYGVVTMLSKLIRDKKPDYFVLAFDSQTPTFRRKIYPDYKAHRPPLPEDLPAQFESIKEFVKLYPLPSLQVNGFEADDIIATLARKAKSQHVKTFIVSGDKDLMQMVDDDVWMYDAMKDKEIDAKGVEEKFGVPPNQVGDVLALMGDASDNIPGVEGVGSVTALKLIKEWGSLDNLLKHAEDIKGKVGEKLRAQKDQALLSKYLVNLHQDVPISSDVKDFVLSSPNQEALNVFYSEHDFHSLVSGPEKQDNSVSAISNENQAQSNYEFILDENKLDEWVKKIEAAPAISFDTETTGLDPRRATLVGMSFSANGESCYIPVAHSYLGCPDQLSLETVLKKIKPILEDEAKPKWGQNSKFDMAVYSSVGVKVQGVKGDSLLASYLINPESPHNLDRLAKEYLNYDTLKFADVVPKGGTFDQVDVKTACRYAAEDADITYRLVEKLHPLLKAEGLFEIYEEMEVPLVEALFRMEECGVLVDVNFLSKLGKEFSDELRSLEIEIYKQAGVEFNLQSPKQVAEVLFGKLGLPTFRKTKTGFSTDADVLEEMKELHPVPSLLLKYRMLSKLMSTYVEQLQNLVNPKTGRIHTNYNQTVAATGRLSSTDPNLQNIPIRTEEGRRIREAFVCPKDFKILSADYSQIELRLLAAFTKDPNLLEAFQKDEDIHRRTASLIFGKPVDEVTSEDRARAKTVNFGVLYGQGPFGLATQLDITNAEAKKIIEAFFTQFPSVALYREKILKEAKTKGYVTTWQRRRRYLPDLHSKNFNMRSNAERNAFNTIFQGSAADLIKVAMIQIDKKLQNKKSRMLMQVHDELVFEVAMDELDEISLLIKQTMEQAIVCDVPLKVEIGVGDNWAKAH